MADKKKVLMAPVVAAGSLVVVFGMVLGLQAIGFGCGWLVLFGITAYLMSEKGPSKAGIMPFVCGSILGMLGGQLFTLFMPGFILFALALLTCKMGGWLTSFMNDYALLYMTVYTIGGVANPVLLWQDLLVHGVLCLVLAIVVMAIAKKGEGKAGSPMEVSA